MSMASVKVHAVRVADREIANPSDAKPRISVDFLGHLTGRNSSGYPGVIIAFEIAVHDTTATAEMKKMIAGIRFQ